MNLLLILFFSKFIQAEKLQLWHQMLPTNRLILEGAVKDWEKANPEHQVHVIYRETEELRSGFQSAAMGGTGPELIYGPSDQVGPFATMKIIRPMDDLLTDLSEFDPLAVVKYQGSIFSVGDMVGNHLMLIYNKKLLQNPPRNTDELIEIGKKFTKDDNGDGKIDRYGLVWNFTEPYFFVPWVAGFGSWFLNDDFTPNLNSEGVIKAFSFVKSLRDVHKIIPQECDYEIANALFKEGKAAMIVNGDWSWGDYVNAKIDFGVVPIPMVSQTGLWPAPLVGTKGYSVNANVAPEKMGPTVDLLKHLLSTEVQKKFAIEVGILPSRASARQQDNDRMAGSSASMTKGKPMPIVPEVRAVWDSLRPVYQSILGGKMQPQEAGQKAQDEALRQISVMNEVVQPNWQASLLQGIFVLVALFALYKLFKALSGNTLFKPENRFALIMTLPAMAAVFFVIIYPLVFNFVLSFSNFSLRTFRDWQVVGFQNYFSVLSEKVFWVVFGKTIIWTAVNVLSHTVIGVFLAVLINQTLPGKRLMRVLLIIPWAVPQYITALTWRNMFNQEYGSINNMLTSWFHLSPVQWLGDPFNAFAACIITNIWLGFPFMMVVALGGLQSIPNDLYEAADIDGATSWQKFRNITWPMLTAVMYPAMTLGVVWTFNALNVVWLVSNAGEPADSTHILVSYVYKAAFNLYRYGYGAALSVLIFFILLGFGIKFLTANKATESIQ